MGDTSDKVQIVSAIVSLVGTVFAGFITYLMAKLKSEQESRATTAAIKVEQIQRVLARIEDNRAQMAVIRAVLEAHGNTLVDHVKDTASRLAADPDPSHIHAVLAHHAEMLVATTRATVAKLTALDAAESHRSRSHQGDQPSWVKDDPHAP